MILLFTASQAQETVYVGKKFPGFRVYIFNLADEIILAESGGTSMKMGGTYTQLYRNRIDGMDANVIAASEDQKSFLQKKGRHFYFTDDKGRCFKLKQETYDDDKDRIRFGMFRMYFYKKYGGNSKVEVPSTDFKVFKKDPLNYLKAQE